MKTENETLPIFTELQQVAEWLGIPANFEGPLMPEIKLRIEELQAGLQGVMDLISSSYVLALKRADALDKSKGKPTPLHLCHGCNMPMGDCQCP